MSGRRCSLFCPMKHQYAFILPVPCCYFVLFYSAFSFVSYRVDGVLSSFAQRQTGLFHTPQKRAVRFRAMEWNVENLYDTLHDELRR